MKILIVSGFFYPQNTPRSFRTVELAKELVRQNHCVTVYIPQNNYDYIDFKKEYDMNIRFVGISRRKNFELNGNKLYRLVKRIANRFLNTYLSYPDIQYLWKLPKLFSKLGAFDLLISIAVPHPIHWGVDRALRKNPKLASTWVADCGDPFMFCKTDTFRNPFYFKSFEKSFCRRANYITVPVESGKKGYYPEFSNKIRVIPQGFDFSTIRKVDKYNPNKIITFAYAGGFIPGFRDPRPILDYLANQTIDFIFFIYTNESIHIEKYKHIIGKKLIISDYIDREELIYRMSGYDFVLNIENGTSIQVPSKLIDYGLCGRPILSINSQKLDREKFFQFLNRDYSQQYLIKNIEDYNIINIANNFLSLSKILD